MNFDKKDMQCAQTSKKRISENCWWFQKFSSFSNECGFRNFSWLMCRHIRSRTNFHLGITLFSTTFALPLHHQSHTVQLYSLLNQALGNFRQEMHFARVGKLIGAARHFDWDGNNVTGPSPISIKSWKHGSGISGHILLPPVLRWEIQILALA